MWGLARWHWLRDQGTYLLWRIERRKARRVQDVLPDGSYLARIEANRVDWQAVAVVCGS